MNKALYALVILALFTGCAALYPEHAALRDKYDMLMKRVDQLLEESEGFKKENKRLATESERLKADLRKAKKTIEYLKNYPKPGKTASELVEKYLAQLPAPEKRSIEQKKKAMLLKILLAQSKYATGDYRAAAEIFDKLRRTMRCPKCGYEEILKLSDFDREMPSCPKCKDKKTKLEKVNNNNLEVVEGAAKSYLAIYEKLDKKNMAALNKAQDIYQRLLKKITPYAHKPEYRDKYWEVIYIIVKIWYYKRDYGRIVGEISNMILSVDSDQDNPTEDDWKEAFPQHHWREKIKDLYKKALEKINKDK